MKIDFNKLKKDSENFKIKSGDSYIQTYLEFVNYFKDLKVIKKENLVIGAHFVYGWMPTIIHLNLKNKDKVLGILNEARKDVLISESDLGVLKLAINNSMVGVSKLLHFISPKKYAIWDRRIYKYIYGKESAFRIQQPKLYREYLLAIDEVLKNKEFKAIHLKVQNACGYKVTPVRAVELIMFESRNK